MRFPLWLCSLFAGLLCYPAAWVYRGMRAIPVHRSSRKLVQTLQETMEALEQGENVMVLTDVSYTNTDGEVGELYGGFVYVARLYKRKTGKDLRIVPVLPDIRTRTLFFHEALIYREEAGYGAEKERMKAQLHGTELADAARDLPVVLAEENKRAGRKPARPPYMGKRS